MHREPREQKEFDRWAFFMEKGMSEGNIDWDNIRACACRAMQEEAITHDATGTCAFDRKGRCLKCGSEVSLAEVTDVVASVDDGSSMGANRHQSGAARR